MKMWYEKEGRDEDVVLSTKACIVRNVKGYNFPYRKDTAGTGKADHSITAFQGQAAPCNHTFT